MNALYFRSFTILYKELLQQSCNALVYKQKLINLRRELLADDIELEKNFLELFDSYFNTMKYEMKIVLYILQNAIKIDSFAADRVFEGITDCDENNCNYFKDVIGRFRLSCAKGDSSYFYVSKRNFKYIDESNYMDYINLAKGFDFQNVRDFICNNDIYSLDELRKVLHNTSYIDYGDERIGIYQDGLVLPIVNDDKSALQAIELIVRKALLDSKENINDDRLVNSKALPIYYQMLYKKRNKFVKFAIPKYRLANILQYKQKKEDNFEKVVKRIKRIKNS